ncbi:MAG: hypothetical protein ABIT04_09970 [Novosphingobium sp.]
MPADLRSIPTGYRPGSPRERLAAIVLSAAIIVAGLLIALYQTGYVPVKLGERGIATFNVAPEGARSAQAKARPRPERQARAQPRQSAMPRPRIVIRTRPQRAQPVDAIPGFVHLSREDLASGDIGRMRAATDGQQGNGQAAVGPGEGPGGMHLYPADWYREPTDAQLAGYLPKDRPRAGWGTIACQTIEHYRVDNCRIIDESPRGSGLGLAVLNAAWQFQVLPPRINSRPQVGSWVRIRITYSERGAEAGWTDDSGK